MKNRFANSRIGGKQCGEDSSFWEQNDARRSRDDATLGEPGGAFASEKRPKAIPYQFRDSDGTRRSSRRYSASRIFAELCSNTTPALDAAFTEGPGSFTSLGSTQGTTPALDVALEERPGGPMRWQAPPDADAE